MATTNKQIPIVREFKLYRYDGTPICEVGPRTGWFDWLADPRHKSFRYHSPTGAHFTAVCERRRSASGGALSYWYAHRRRGGKLQRAYLGKPEKLTRYKLEHAAMKLAQLPLQSHNTAQRAA